MIIFIYYQIKILIDFYYKKSSNFKLLLGQQKNLSIKLTKIC